MTNACKRRLGCCWLTVLLGIGCVTGSVFAQRAGSPVGIDEKLSAQVPLDLVFNDEDGKPVPLRALITKPTLLTLVYFECPGICSPLLNGLTTTIDRTDLEPGKDYQILTISFNEDDGFPLAAKKKANYLKQLHRPFPASAWRFMTGEKKQIDALTDAVGFRFQRTGDQFQHAGVITVLTPEGKVCRYLYGISFLPFDIKMSAIEASKGKTMPSVANRVLAFCYSYDPEGRKYVFNILKVAGIAVFTMIGLFAAWLVIKSRRTKKGQAITP